MLKSISISPPSFRTLSAHPIISDQSNAYSRLTSIPFRPKRCRLPKQPITISCSYSDRGTSRSGSGPSDEFLEASILLSETLFHYGMRKQGFQEVSKWLPASSQGNEPRFDFNLIMQALFWQFHSPTIFLKISCQDDFLLPITVGEFAIEKLIGVSRGGESEGCPDQFQFARNMVEKLGYQVRMAKITKRVVNTYYARLYLSKPGNDDVISVDARPSDAINVALRCKAPIYINKQFVLTDAINISYVMRKLHNTKCTYDVLLDSAADGPDLLAEELDLVKNMNLAVVEERYSDAAMWRDKLMKFRTS